MDYSPPGPSVYGDSPSKNTGVGFHALPPGDLPNPWIKPALQVDSLPSEPPGKHSLPESLSPPPPSLMEAFYLKAQKGVLEEDLCLALVSLGV